MNITIQTCFNVYVFYTYVIAFEFVTLVKRQVEQKFVRRQTVYCYGSLGTVLLLVGAALVSIFRRGNICNELCKVQTPEYTARAARVYRYCELRSISFQSLTN